MTYTILARTAPTSTVALPLTGGLLLSSSEAAVLSSLTVTNTTGLSVVYSVYLCRDGLTTPSIDNALVFQQVIKKNEVLALTYGITLGWKSGNQDVIFVESGTPDALTFTAFGSKVGV